MKHIIMLSFLFASGNAFAQIPTTTDFKKLDWLEGTWSRTNTKPGQSGHERWVKVSASEWTGWGVTLSGRDTTYVEKLKLITRNNELFYVADVPENKQPVEFRFTELTNRSFTCENPQHDFPKKITYEKDGNKIKAAISGNGKRVDYWFEKNK